MTYYIYTLFSFDFILFLLLCHYLGEPAACDACSNGSPQAQATAAPRARAGDARVHERVASGRRAPGYPLSRSGFRPTPAMHFFIPHGGMAMGSC